jgi:hypothetical protein
VLLIDTPGFDDTTRSDTDILKIVAHFLSTAQVYTVHPSTVKSLILGVCDRYKNGMRLSGVIYMHRISDFRMGGVAKRNFNMFVQLCGERSLKNVALVTNMWSEVPLELGEAREAELRNIFFKPVLDKHARLLRHENTLQSAQAILRHLISNRPIVLRIQRELVEDHLDISQTAAGAELNRELIEQRRKHQEELQNIQIEMKAAIEARDDEARRELEEETRKLEAKMTRLQMDSQKLAYDYKQEMIRMEGQMHTMAEAARRDAERAATEHKQQMEAISLRLQHETNASAAQKDTIQRQMSDMQLRYEISRNHASSGGGLFGQIGRILDTLLKFI